MASENCVKCQLLACLGIFITMLGVFIGRAVVIQEAYPHIKVSVTQQRFENYLKFVQSDLDAKLVTGLYISKDGKGCDEPALLRVWAGSKSYATNVQKKKKKGSGTETVQEFRPATGAIKGSHFKDGVQLCLKYEGDQDHTWAKKSVNTASRIGAKVCNDGFIPCSEKAEQTICVKPENKESECPVTDILLLDKSEVVDYQELLKDYVKAEVSPDDSDLTWSLYYSKTQGNLPLYDLKLSYRRPCTLDNSIIDKSRNNKLTRDPYRSSCGQGKLDDLMRGSWDLISNEVTVNEGDFLNYIGAYKRLDGLPGSNLVNVKEEVQKYKAGFSDSNLSIWQKDRFKWKASCQETKNLSEFSRLIKTTLEGSSITEISNYNQKVDDANGTFEVFIIVTSVMFGLKFFGTGIIGGSREHKKCWCIGLLGWIATDLICIIMAILAIDAEHELSDETLSMSEIDLNSQFVPLIEFADCSDPVFAYSFSMIDRVARVSFDYDQIDHSKTLGTVYLILLIFQILSVPTFICCNIVYKARR